MEGGASVRRAPTEFGQAVERPQSDHQRARPRTAVSPASEVEQHFLGPLRRCKLEHGGANRGAVYGASIIKYHAGLRIESIVPEAECVEYRLCPSSALGDWGL